MSRIKRIALDVDETKRLDNLVLSGQNRNKDIGLEVHVPVGSVLSVYTLIVSNCFINLIKTGDGLLRIEHCQFSEFGGDAANIRGSNVVIGDYRVRNNTPTRSYANCYREGNETIAECLARHDEVVFDPDLLDWEHDEKANRFYVQGYHVDAGAHIYAVKKDGWTVDPDGLIENVVIRSVDVEVTGKQSQAFMLSEACRYRGIDIGRDGYRVITDGYPYHFVANTLEDSWVGCQEGCVVGPGTKVRVENVKGSQFESRGILLAGIDKAGFEGSVLLREDGVEFVTGDIKEKKSGEVVVSELAESEVVLNERTTEGRDVRPRGVRNNNPGNIEDGSANKWVGLADEDERVGRQLEEDRFCVFVDPVYGIRAMAKLLQNYQSRSKLKTVRQIIERWAPAKDRNNTSVYVAVVAAALDVGPDDIVSMRDFDTLFVTVKAIIKHENGVDDIYSDELIYRGLAMSGVDMPDELSSVDSGRRSREKSTGTAVIGGAATVPAIEVAKQYFEEPVPVETVIVDTVEDGKMVPVEVVKPGVESAVAWYEAVSLFDIAQLVFLGIIAGAAVMWLLDRRLTKRMGIR